MEGIMICAVIRQHWWSSQAYYSHRAQSSSTGVLQCSSIMSNVHSLARLSTEEENPDHCTPKSVTTGGCTDHHHQHDHCYWSHQTRLRHDEEEKCNIIGSLGTSARDCDSYWIYCLLYLWYLSNIGDRTKTQTLFDKIWLPGNTKYYCSRKVKDYLIISLRYILMHK